MAAQPPQRHRKNASPRAGPQPIRATMPFTLRQSSPIRGSNGRRSSPGPASSPTQPWPENHKKHSRRSPDHRSSPERSPSTPGFRVEKPKAVKASQIRRTNSLDTIYLSGHWPRPESGSSSISYGPYSPNQKHQSTQTDEVDRKSSSHKRSSSWGSSDNLKEKLKQQLRKQNSRSQSSTSNQRASPVHGNHSTSHYSSSSPSSSSNPSTTSTSTNTTPTAATQTEEPAAVTLSTSRSTSTAIPVPTLKAPSTSPRIRGSVEGLNQEIETLVLHGISTDQERQLPGPTPEGHRAPVPRLRSVDTQTPAADDSSDNGSRSASRSHSVSPTTFPMDGSRPSSRSSSTGNGEVKVEKVSPADHESSPEIHYGPKYATSPSHNKSYQLTRCPPDGCERARPMEEQSRPVVIESNSNALCPDKRVSFKLKPSDGSAFCPLLPDRTTIVVREMAAVQIKETTCAE